MDSSFKLELDLPLELADDFLPCKPLQHLKGVDGPEILRCFLIRLDGGNIQHPLELQGKVELWDVAGDAVLVRAELRVVGIPKTPQV